jgi:hypothetical protein
MNHEDREIKIAKAIREYSEKEMVDRKWLDDCYSDDNRFRNSFCQIQKSTGDFDLSLWFISYGQSFGKETDLMHEKIAKVVKDSNKPVISFQKDLPNECPFLERKEMVARNIFDIDFKQSPKKIQDEIWKTFRSEKFYRSNIWCNALSFSTCQHKQNCPLNSWIFTLKNVKLPYIFERRGLNSRVFFLF